PAGYAGGYSQLKAYVARIRPRPEPEPVVRFETPPGRQAQFDFATIRLPWGTRFALLVVLGYSRVLFVEFVARQTALTVMLGLERAFAAFGGVPRDPLRSDEERDSRRPPPGRRAAARKSRVPPLRRPLGLPDPRVSPLPGEDEGQGRAAGRLPPREFPLRPDLPGRRRPGRSVRPLACPCQSA